MEKANITNKHIICIKRSDHISCAVAPQTVNHLLGIVLYHSPCELCNRLPMALFTSTRVILWPAAVATTIANTPFGLAISYVLQPLSNGGQLFPMHQRLPTALHSTIPVPGSKMRLSHGTLAWVYCIIIMCKKYTVRNLPSASANVTVGLFSQGIRYFPGL